MEGRASGEPIIGKQRVMKVGAPIEAQFAGGRMARLDRDAWVEGAKHGHELVIANVRCTALHRRDDATLCVCMTCGISWREGN
jgi:hypothetical protein